MTDPNPRDASSAYPTANISASEFESWVTDLYRAVDGDVEDLRVTPHEVVRGTDGDYDLDATVRFRWGGLDFLVLVEAKCHRHPIKRELVASLHSKMQSTGAQKGVLLATSRFQRGAIEFAKVHGISLVEVTEGRFTILARSADAPPPPTRAQALEEFGLPVFVGFTVEPT